ncbi:MAG: class A beta-lactamase-related serine hydrolase [Candidatus Absconditabacteria bacterium]|nr:class A beta-lactamase-related serine hydrolase [Candidatus Absconditabacteria bacterium]
MPASKNPINSPKKQIIFYLLILLGVIFGLTVGFFFGKLSTKQIISGFLYTNPVLDYDVSSSIMDNKNVNLEQDLQEYLEVKKGKNKTTHISVYFRNLNNGNRFGINEKEEFSPASLMKLPLLISYYKLFEENPDILKEKLLYIPDPEEQKITQNIKPEKTLSPYQKYNIKELLDRMILYSDNRSSILLENSIDFELYKKSFTDIGINFPEFKDGMFENNINIVEYASFFRVLYNASYLNRSDSEYILDLLSNTSFLKGLTRGVPDNIVVSHKFGERVIDGEKQLHDCGIVYYPNHPYILCVMTRGRDWEVLKNIITDVSQKIYNEVDLQYNKK